MVTKIEGGDLTSLDAKYHLVLSEIGPLQNLAGF